MENNDFLELIAQMKRRKDGAWRERARVGSTRKALKLVARKFQAATQRIGMLLTGLRGINDAFYCVLFDRRCKPLIKKH